MNPAVPPTSPMRANISLNGPSSDALLEDWLWLLQKSHYIVAMNHFGDMFLRDATRAIWLLRIAWGTVDLIADSVTEFQSSAGGKERQRVWFLTDFLTELESIGVALSDGQCFAFKKPLKLRGVIQIANLGVAPILIRVSLQGQLLRQLRDLQAWNENPRSQN